MNNGNLRTILVIIIGLLIFGVILKVLPYIIIGVIAVYLINKVYKFVKLKLNKSHDKIESSGYTYTVKEEENEFEEDDFDTSSAIDVDYKDVK